MGTSLDATLDNTFEMQDVATDNDTGAIRLGHYSSVGLYPLLALGHCLCLLIYIVYDFLRKSKGIFRKRLNVLYPYLPEAQI